MKILYFFSFFYQYTALSSRTVDGHSNVFGRFGRT